MFKNDVVNCVIEHLDKWYASANHKETAIQLVDEYEERIRADERDKVLDECKRRLLEDLIPLKDKYFDLAKGTAMPERYVHLKRMGVVEMIIEIVKMKTEQLKEQKNDKDNM